MLYTIPFGSTSNIIRVKLYDASSAVGAGLKSLLNSSTGLIISTIANNEAAATVYTAAGATIDTITTLGTYAAPTAGHCRFKEVDATNHPGVYEFQFADARFAVSNSSSLVISILGASNLVEQDVVIQLPAVSGDPWATALPGAYGAGTAGSILGNNLDAKISTRAPIVRTGTAQGGTANTITLDAGASAQNSIYNWNILLIVSGTGAGQTNTIYQYNGTTKVASMYNGWYINPDATSVFVILATNGVSPATYQTFNVLDKNGYSTDLEIRKNYCQAGSTTTVINLDAGASGLDGAYSGCLIFFATGAAAGLFGTIQSYLQFTKQATLKSALLVAPGGGDQFIIYPPAGSGDPWAVPLPGSYAAGTAGNILGNRLDIAISAAPPLVWDVINSSHLIVGSTGKDLFDAYNAALGTYNTVQDPLFGNPAIKTAILAIPPAPTAVQIDTQLSGTHGASAWTKASGTGNTAVSDAYPTADYLRVLDAVTSVPLAGVRIVAYLTADYNAGNLGQAYIQGESLTKNDGRWMVPIYLLSGHTYTLVFVDNGYVTNTITLIIP